MATHSVHVTLRPSSVAVASGIVRLRLAPTGTVPPRCRQSHLTVVEFTLILLINSYEFHFRGRRRQRLGPRLRCLYEAVWRLALTVGARNRPDSTRSRPSLRPGDPYGTRTRVFAVRGRRPGPLDEGAFARRPGAYGAGAATVKLTLRRAAASSARHVQPLQQPGRARRRRRGAQPAAHTARPPRRHAQHRAARRDPHHRPRPERPAALRGARSCNRRC